MEKRKIGRQHIAFYRGWLQGLDLGDLGDRYLDTGIDLRRAKSTLNWIKSEIRQAAIRNGKFGMARLLRLSIQAAVSAQKAEPDSAAPSLEAFREDVDPDGFYTEKELIEAYTSQYKAPQAVNRKQMMIERQLRALAWVEALLVSEPQPDDLVSAWLDKTVADRLALANIPTLKALKTHIADHGYRWWMTVPRLGEKGAMSLSRWLDAHKSSLGQLPAYTKTPIRLIPKATLVEQRPQETGIVPLSSLIAPPGLTGESGRNRHQSPPLIQAKDDLQAIGSWLSMKAPSNNTQQAYRKEAERLALWSIIERQKALSDLTVDDCAAYRDWLGMVGRTPDEKWGFQVPQSDWVSGLDRKGRHSAGWKPIRQPLSAKSIKHAIGILSGMFNWLIKVQYLAFNPWVAVSMTIASQDDADAPDLELTRALTKGQWQYLLEYVDELPDSREVERIRFILQLGYLTGMRRAEMVSATTGRLYSMPLSNGVGSRWMLKVEGKGRKWRAVPVTTTLMSSLSRYLASRGLSPIPTDNPEVTTLIASLDGKSITANMLYRILKGAFSKVAAKLRTEGKEHDARHFDLASTHWLRHTRGSHLGQDGTQATLIQKLLGHASIATTSIYTRSDDETLWNALSESKKGA